MQTSSLLIPTIDSIDVQLIFLSLAFVRPSTRYIFLSATKIGNREG